MERLRKFLTRFNTMFWSCWFNFFIADRKQKEYFSGLLNFKSTYRKQHFPYPSFVLNFYRETFLNEIRSLKTYATTLITYDRRPIFLLLIIFR